VGISPNLLEGVRAKSEPKIRAKSTLDEVVGRSPNLPPFYTPTMNGNPYHRETPYPSSIDGALLLTTEKSLPHADNFILLAFVSSILRFMISDVELILQIDKRFLSYGNSARGQNHSSVSTVLSRYVQFLLFS
jgi:hypothetical protein